MSKLKFFKARDSEIAWMDARLDMSKAKTDTGAVKDKGEILHV